MALDARRYETSHDSLIRDMRPIYVRVMDTLVKKDSSAVVFLVGAFSVYMGYVTQVLDVFVLLFFGFFLILKFYDNTLAFKLPATANTKDKHNEGPGRSGKAEGILYLGNVEKDEDEVWFTNSDARTHILYLGTTGAGKTEGLKSIATNAMAWGSGFVYIDGKADTDLWSSLSSLVRRFGRDDDLLVLNYMTGNSDTRAPSNTMNPFSSGSASYLTNMLVSLMPNAEGDNAMWKERAVSLVSSLMPVLTWKRDHQDIPMSVSMIRDNLNLDKIIKLSRDEAIPEELRVSLTGYLDTLPGYIAEAFDDQGKEKPMGPDQPPPDTTTCRQQHGYLSMQFTRSLQSLGDDYGYIFDTQAADVDMTDVVLNRRILVVLIPALEKSGDEIANLGKIVAATIKGMMGSTLGANVEGDSAKVIENKPTNAPTPFITIFDEVGYYTAEGMAVMAAQARSLGFCLVFSGQDLPAMKKRVKEEANSITANCSIKIFGKLEDPTDTKDFFEKTVGSIFVTETSGFQGSAGSSSYFDNKQASVQTREKAGYGELRGYKEGQAVITFGEEVMTCQFFYSNSGKAKAMRVTRYISLPPTDETMLTGAASIAKLRDRMVHKSWTAMKAEVAIETEEAITYIREGLIEAKQKKCGALEQGICAVTNILAKMNSKVYDELSAPKPPKTATAIPSASDKDKKPALFAPKNETAAPQEEAAGTSPLAKLLGKKELTAEEKIQAQEQQPVSWKKLVEESEAEERRKLEQQQPSTPTTETDTDSSYKLPGTLFAILRNAALKANEFIFKNKE